MITGNEPAMPLSLLDYEGEIHSNEDITYECKGLTIRQQFAAMAMQGILSNSNELICNNLTVNDGWQHSQTIVEICLNMADALINELNKKRSI